MYFYFLLAVISNIGHSCKPNATANMLDVQFLGTTILPLSTLNPTTDESSSNHATTTEQALPGQKKETKKPNCLPKKECGQENAKSPVKTSKTIFERIVGGFEASPHSLRWMAQINIGGWFKCGGAVISSEWVLSAAHCFTESERNDPKNRVKVILGTDRLDDKDAVVCQVSEIHVGKDWKKENNNVDDIALLKINCDNEIFTNENIAAACLPSADADFQTDSNTLSNFSMLASGWGASSYYGRAMETLQQVYLNIVPLITCAVPYTELAIAQAKIGDKMMCAFMESKDTCQGDSGGPLMAKIGDKWTIIGIVSFGLGCANPKYPGVYTHVPSYIEFIKEKTGL